MRGFFLMSPARGMHPLSGHRGRSGFALIEVIIVSVIVAILAAAAIPVYTGYVRSQKKSMAKSLAQSAAVTANVYYRRTASNPTVAQLNLFLSDANRYKVTISSPYVVVSDTSSPSDPQTDSAAFR